MLSADASVRQRTIIDVLQAIRDEFDLSQIICWFDQGCMLPVEEVKHCMALFADTVMPGL